MCHAVQLLIIIVAVQFQDANCGNTLLISLEELVKDGLLKKEELPEPVYFLHLGYSDQVLVFISFVLLKLCNSFLQQCRACEFLDGGRDEGSFNFKGELCSV